MAAKVKVDTTPAEVRCPRCRTGKAEHLRRGHLDNQSAFIPAKKRGKKKLQRVRLYCLNCGYSWRSELVLAPEVQAIEDRELMTMRGLPAVAGTGG